MRYATAILCGRIVPHPEPGYILLEVKDNTDDEDAMMILVRLPPETEVPAGFHVIVDAVPTGDGDFVAQRIQIVGGG